MSEETANPPKDETIVEPIKIPGMQITFSSPLSPDNKGISFVLACDTLAPQGWLDERLDVIAAVTRRQAAIEELPIVKQSLYANRKLLKTARLDRDRAQAKMEASRWHTGSRPRRVDPAPGDVNAVAQHDARILQIEGQIEGAKARIPYLEAIVEGREPPELFPDEDDDVREAAD